MLTQLVEESWEYRTAREFAGSFTGLAVDKIGSALTNFVAVAQVREFTGKWAVQLFMTQRVGRLLRCIMSIPIFGCCFPILRCYHFRVTSKIVTRCKAGDRTTNPGRPTHEDLPLPCAH